MGLTSQGRSSDETDTVSARRTFRRTGAARGPADAGPAVCGERPGALARPSTEEPFQATSCTTYEGHALAVVRPTGAEGPVTVTVRAEGLPPATIEVRQPAPEARPSRTMAR
ncbi:hypothetical protein ACU635_28750 [[Actinomadura] parvosata]|uniref:hypothetical protein n=1 Tax=[Actinomadura] parvosata TaxID=1955412 RepID=UPI00406C91EE